MAKVAAIKSVVQDMIYENLSVSSSYGALANNARFRTEYIDEAINSADIKLINILKQNKQDSLLNFTTNVTGFASGAELDNMWVIRSVTFKKNSNPDIRSTEMPYPNLKLLLDSKYTWSYTSSYGYHAIKDGKIYYKAPAGYLAHVEYIDLSAKDRQDDLVSPAGFENVIASFATAQLLMKRLDKPEESQFYERQAYSFLQEYGIPESPKQETSN